MPELALIPSGEHWLTLEFDENAMINHKVRLVDTDDFTFVANRNATLALDFESAFCKSFFQSSLHYRFFESPTKSVPYIKTCSPYSVRLFSI